eukprot:13337432-Alexandrium_andersonii.AAC.1
MPRAATSPGASAAVPGPLRPEDTGGRGRGAPAVQCEFRPRCNLPTRIVELSPGLRAPAWLRAP